MKKWSQIGLKFTSERLKIFLGGGVCHASRSPPRYVYTSCKSSYKLSVPGYLLYCYVRPGNKGRETHCVVLCTQTIEGLGGIALKKTQNFRTPEITF